MFRSMNSEHFSKGNTAPSTPTGHGVASLIHENQESSWISMFSMVSRPAWSLFQKYLPGRSRTPALSDNVSVWVGEELRQNLDDIMPATRHPAHLAYLACQHGGTGHVDSSGTRTLSWLTEDSLSELGIQNVADNDSNPRQQAPVGLLATARNAITHAFFNVAPNQEIRHAEHSQVQVGDVLSADVVAARSKSNWWGRIWGADDNAQSWLPNVSWVGEGTEANAHHSGDHYSGHHCQPAQCSTTGAVAKPTELFVHCDDGGSVHNESAGPSCYKESTDNGSLHMPRPESLPSSDKLLLDDQCSVFSHLVNARAVAACSEVVVLTPDQDNGYSSLEEEHSNSRLHNMRPPCEEQGPADTDRADATEGSPAESEASLEPLDREAPFNSLEEEEEESDLSDSEEEAEESPAQEQQSEAPLGPSAPRCENKAIAYIMGSPCSGGSESEDDSDWESTDDDDDGFDSEGSSHFSDSEDPDDSGDEEKDSDEEEANSETERLWNSLCQNADPYNPRNFTALQQTAPRPSAAAGPPGSVSPVEAPGSVSPAERPASSPRPLEPPGDESWEEASEVDEGESLRLWNALSCSADPYSPLNFQAPLRTREPAGGRCKSGPPATAPRYRSEEAEERLDSGFSEAGPSPGQTGATCTRLKKVTFVEEVEEFYASSDEDRRGPWEEFARDRCRFQRRVQEVEETISYCLAPTFRLLTFQRLYHSS